MTALAIRPGTVGTDLVREMLENERVDGDLRRVRRTVRDEGTMAGLGDLGRVIARLVLAARGKHAGLGCY